MRLNENVLNDVINNIQDGIYILNPDREIVYWNKAAENISGFKSTEVVGSCCRDNILEHVTSDGVKLCKKELCPAYKTLMSGQTCESDDVYLHHKHGHRVGVVVRTSAIRNENGEIEGVLELFQEKRRRSAIEEELAELRELLTVDDLTKVGNRQFGENKIEECIKQFNRYRWPFGLIFFDIDHFKKFNDDFGHDAGDRVLKMVAETVRSNVRAFDHVVRWGGEEFVVISINVDEEKLKSIAEKIRELVGHSFFEFDGQNHSVTVSVGGTICRKDDTVDSIVKRADELMYESKKNGRNMVTIG